MPPGPTREPVPVTLVRTARGTAGGPDLQEWRSDATGRIHEIPQSRSYAPNAALRPGAEGWLWFADGRPWVSDSDRFDVPKRTIRTHDARPPSAARDARGPSRRIPWGLLLAAALIVVIIAGIR